MKKITEKCICGGISGTKSSKNGLKIITCNTCNLIRQDLGVMTLNKLSDYYTKTYHKKHYSHSYKQDQEVAEKRLKEYKIKSKSKLLDIGSGNGAFVSVARQKGIESYGSEIAKDADKSGYCYNESLQDTYFPTDDFDYITLHDCLEHVPKPIDMLEEIFRITKQKGTVIIEIPDFFCEEGKHHWKQIEHIWLFTEEQIKEIFKSAGFKIKKITSPIKGKKVFYLTKPEQKRIKIMVPPGIGDIYWSLIKIKSFCEKNNLGIPDIYISSLHQARERSIDYVRRCPFVNAAGYNRHEQRPEEFREAYMLDKKHIYTKVAGMDYFITFNGSMRFGKSVDMMETLYDTDWMFPMFQSLEERRYAIDLKKKIGEYFVAYFVPHGMYGEWLKDYSQEKIISMLKNLHEATGKKIILVGANWDAGTFIDSEKDYNGFYNLIGETNLPQCFSLLRYAEAVIGFPSGITIMASRFRTPTLLFWNKYFDEGFFRNSCPPQSYKNWYDYVVTDDPEIDKNIFEKLGKITNQVIEIESTDVPENKPITKGNIVIACVYKKGKIYNPEYVKKLKNGVERVLKNINYRFVCLTDDKNIDFCETIPLKHNWKGWWSKIELFRPGIYDGARVIYFDLDTVLIKGFSELLSTPRKITMLKAFNPSKHRNSGVMVFRGGDYPFIYNDFATSPVMKGGDGDYIYTKLRKNKIRPLAVQRTTQVSSYKHHCQDELPQETQIVCFHGEPRPHKVKDEWMKEYWK